VIWRDEASMALIPFIKYQKPIDGHATAYVCQNFECNQPVDSASAMLRLLEK
jgi:uncharacterized protein YyaL (SSP411 family)